MTGAADGPTAGTTKAESYDGSDDSEPQHVVFELTVTACLDLIVFGSRNSLELDFHRRRRALDVLSVSAAV